MARPNIKDHLDRWGQALDHRSRWTEKARKDKKIAGGQSWRKEELEAFKEQNRDPVSYNLVLPMLQVVGGIEAQQRSDILILPRTQPDADTALALTRLFKYVSDQNGFDRQLSRAFRDCCTVGVGWIEAGYNPDPMAEKILLRRVDPLDMWVDPACREPDLSDAKDLYRGAWMNPEDLARLFPAKKREIMALAEAAREKKLDHSADYANDYGDRPPVGYEDLLDRMVTPQGQIRAVERWYRVDEWSQFVRYPDGRVVEVTPENADLLAGALVYQNAKLLRGLAHRIRVAVFAGDILLGDNPSPYDHGKYPFVPLWAFEDEDGDPMGLVRLVKDAQREYNARSTSLLNKTLNRQVWFEKGVFEDIERARQELAAHDGMVELVPGALTAKRIQRVSDVDSTPVEMQLLTQAKDNLQEISGAVDEVMGRETNARSGAAIEARQSQGRTTLYLLYDARNWTQVQVAERTLSMMQSTYTEEMAIRITDSINGLDWITVNQALPDGTVLKDITQGRFDVAISQVPAKPTDDLRQAELLATYLRGADPGVRLLFLPDMARLMGMSNDMVMRIKQYTEQMQAQAMAPQPPAGPAGPAGPIVQQPPLQGGSAQPLQPMGFMPQEGAPLG